MNRLQLQTGAIFVPSLDVRGLSGFLL